MADKKVTAKVDATAQTVVLKGEPGLEFPMNFDVKTGDTLTWVLQDCPPGSIGRIRFVESPGPAPLLERGNEADGSGLVIEGGIVAAKAPVGNYSYDFFLVTAGRETKLRCVWSNGTTTKPTPKDRAPGKKSGGP
jgi:hypothetical protein